MSMVKLCFRNRLMGKQNIRIAQSSRPHEMFQRYPKARREYFLSVAPIDRQNITTLPQAPLSLEPLHVNLLDIAAAGRTRNLSDGLRWSSVLNYLSI